MSASTILLSVWLVFGAVTAIEALCDLQDGYAPDKHCAAWHYLLALKPALALSLLFAVVTTGPLLPAFRFARRLRMAFARDRGA